MSFLIGLAAKILEWLLVLGGHYLYEKANKLVDKQKQKKQEKEAQKKYEETRKKGEKSDEMLDRETDILNGN